MRNILENIAIWFYFTVSISTLRLWYHQSAQVCVCKKWNIHICSNGVRANRSIYIYTVVRNQLDFVQFFKIFNHAINFHCINNKESERASEGVHVIWQLIEELICQCNESILMEWLWLCLWRVSIWDTHNNLIKYPLCCVHATADYYLTVTFFCLVELLNPSIQTLIENSAHFILEIMCECVSGSEPKKYNTYSSWNRGEERKGKVDKTACSDLNKYFNVEPATMNG